MRLIAILISVFVYSHALAATGTGEYWAAGNRCYQEKKYDSAAYYYEKLAAGKPANTEVYYNLGNTYYRLNNIGHAVLNYERAIATDPSNKTAQDNLLLTQSRIKNRIAETKDIFFIKWWNGLTNHSFANTWAVLSALIFISIIGIRAAKRMGKLHSVPGQVNIVLIIAFVLLLTLSFFSANNYDKNIAVVMDNETPFMPAPKAGQSKTIIPEGTTVKIRTEETNWVQAELPDGRTGWIRKSAIEKI